MSARRLSARHDTASPTASVANAQNEMTAAAVVQVSFVCLSMCDAQMHCDDESRESCTCTMECGLNCAERFCEYVRVVRPSSPGMAATPKSTNPLARSPSSEMCSRARTELRSLRLDFVRA